MADEVVNCMAQRGQFVTKAFSVGRRPDNLLTLRTGINREGKCITRLSDLAVIGHGVPVPYIDTLQGEG